MGSSLFASGQVTQGGYNQVRVTQVSGQQEPIQSDGHLLEARLPMPHRSNYFANGH